jgi:hypothetical protein
MWVEYINAITMVLTPIISYPNFTTNMCTQCIFVGSCIHMPFSMLYHVLCANHVFKDPVNNIGRKIDQMFIHLACIVYGFGIHKSTPCILLNTAFNEYCIYCLWQPSDYSSRRRIHILLAIHMYLTPLLHENWIDYVKVMGSILVGSFFFVNKDVFIYGHTIFHLCLGLGMYHLNHYCLMQ